MLACLRSTTTHCCHHHHLFLCSFVLVPTTCLFALVCTCPVVGLYLLGFVHTPALCTCAHPCSFILVSATGSFRLVLLLVCTCSVLHIHLPSVHVLTHICLCWSLLPACLCLPCHWFVPTQFCAYTCPLCMCSPVFMLIPATCLFTLI